MVLNARRQFLVIVRREFPEFRWTVPIIRMGHVRAPDLGSGVEPVDLLDLALAEREARRLDFAIAFTDADLKGYERPHLIAAPASTIGCAAASAVRLWDGLDFGTETEGNADAELAARRGAALACHLLGHLVGIGNGTDPSGFMHSPASAADLGKADHFAERTLIDLRRELADAADPRLEEAVDPDDSFAPPDHRRLVERWHAMQFALRAAIRERSDVIRILRRVRPWALPLRLGRLVTAAASTLAVLLLTAEAWEAGMSQPTLRVIFLSLIALVTATVYLVYRQRLLVRRPRLHRTHDDRRTTTAAHLSEQRSVGNVAIVLGVFLGLGVTYALLFVSALVVAWLFFPPSLVANWAASVQNPHDLHAYLRLAGGVAAVGLAIGALGASFEPRGYVRHVAYVDEEV